MLGVLLGTNGFTHSLESLLSNDLVTRLVQSGEVERERFDTVRFDLVPRDESLRQLLNSASSSINPNVSMETLRLYKKPTGGDWTVSQRTELYNGIVALSTLQGIEYFSKRRGRMRTLYESSVIIDGPDTKNPQTDPVFRTPPPELTLYARQKDLTFGDNVYQYKYSSGESSFVIHLENMTLLTYGIIPVLDKGNLRSVIAVYDCGPYLLVYAASLAKATMLPGMKQRVGESISNRADALLAWFTQKADGVFK
jgi:hypothetical protein